MSIKKPLDDLGSIDESKVVDYLIENPDFFDYHPEVLAHISLPNGRDDNIASLVSRQVELWRDKHQSLETTFKTIVARARENENRSICLHRLAVCLSEKGDWQGVGDVATTALAILRESFPSNVADIWVYGGLKTLVFITPQLYLPTH